MCRTLHIKQGREVMSNNVPVDITVTPHKEHGKNVWELEVVASGKKGGPGNYPPVKVEEKFGGDFQITILDGDGVTFSNDPIWIQAGTNKPAPHVIDSQIKNIKGKGITELTFHDENSGLPMTLTYQLNFSDGSKLDPVILNGGGTVPPRSYSDYLLVGGVAILVTVLLVVLYRRFF